MSQQWFTCAELADAKLPGLPWTKRNIQRLADRQRWNSHPSFARDRDGPGGGREYHVALLPDGAQAALLLRQKQEEVAAAAARRMDPTYVARREQGMRFAQAGEARRDQATQRHQVVTAVRELEDNGLTRSEAVAAVAKSSGRSTSTIWNWLRMASLASAPVEAVRVLMPRYRGRTATADCDPRAWWFFATDYLRPERPAFSGVYRRLLDAAQAQGWAPIPSQKTLERRLLKEVGAAGIVYAREGMEAAKKLYPAQIRDRSVFGPMEAVNADGHKFDVFVRWEDGTIGRPVMLAIQDLYSGRILSHRIDRTENKELVRLAFADLASTWGLPREAYLDNGRGFASKWITGRMQTRFRFKIRDDDPRGVLTQLGVKVHWTLPFSGQSKPIERAFRDLAEQIAKHPACAGAYTGNKPDAKPENYGSAAVPIEDFRQLVAREIALHNTRPGRRTVVCKGRSFAETFDERYPDWCIDVAKKEELQFLLMAAEGVTVSQRGDVTLADNRYYHRDLIEHRGRKVIVRFDPQDLHGDVFVYTLDNRLIGQAECQQAVGFNDVTAAREHAQKRKAWLKSLAQAARLQQAMTVADIARMLPDAPAETVPERRVVRPLFGQAVPKAEALSDQDYDLSLDNLGRALRERAGADVLPFDGGDD